MAKNKTTSFVKELVSRRVPQVVIGYLLAVAGLVPFVDWTVNRYMLSPHLTDLVLLLFICTFPSVALIAYYHGKPGRNKWQKIELIIIPANILITMLVLFMLFSGKSLGATAKKITVQTEDGKEIERIVPKNEHRKSLAIFFFSNKSGNKKADWLQYALPFLITLDINQDIFIDTQAPYLNYSKVKENGFADGLNVPLTLRKKIAEHYHKKHFLSGAITLNNKDYILKIQLFETATGRKIAEETVTGPDIFVIVDEITVKIKLALDIPERYIKKGTDLPISEITTQSIPALKKYVEAIKVMLFRTDTVKGIEYIDQALDKDPNFAIAMFEKMATLNSIGQGEKALSILQKLMQLLYKLPERLQFIVKIQYYTFKKDLDKQIPIAKMWVDLYPEDTTAYNVLAELYSSRGEWDKAIDAHKKVLQLSPEKYDYFHRIGDIYRQTGKYDEALVYYKKYAAVLPEDYRSHTKIGDLYHSRGQYREAKTYYDKALLLETGNISIIIKLAGVSTNLGDFDHAMEQYRNALPACKSPQDRVAVHRAMHKFYEKRGQIQQALNHVELRLTEAAKFSPPFQIAVIRWSMAHLYIQNRKNDIIFQSVKHTETIVEAPYDKIIHFGNMNIYLALEDPDNAEIHLDKLLNEFIIPFKANGLMSRVHESRGNIYELRQQFKEAIASYKKILDVDSTQTAVHLDIARCYFKLEQYGKAQEHIDKTLKVYPMSAKTHLLAAQLFQKTNNIEKAKQHLNTALKIWENADPGYKPAKQAKEIEKQLMIDE